LTFDLLTSGSVHAKVLPWTIRRLYRLAADSSSHFSFRVRTDRDATERPTPRLRLYRRRK